MDEDNLLKLLDSVLQALEQILIIKDYFHQKNYFENFVDDLEQKVILHLPFLKNLDEQRLLGQLLKQQPMQQP
uniref:Uncharacterized protein n=1 Tax=Meloidogyne enterolobii TaxID=390850 RepID=A0A6V7V8V7_MELEN|nr:unnamed protein product [Meloidogyne enterolobii]